MTEPDLSAVTFIHGMSLDECKAALGWLSGYRPEWFDVVREHVTEMRGLMPAGDGSEEGSGG